VHFDRSCRRLAAGVVNSDIDARRCEAQIGAKVDLRFSRWCEFLEDWYRDFSTRDGDEFWDPSENIELVATFDYNAWWDIDVHHPKRGRGTWYPPRIHEWCFVERYRSGRRKNKLARIRLQRAIAHSKNVNGNRSTVGVEKKNLVKPLNEDVAGLAAGRAKSDDIDVRRKCTSSCCQQKNACEEMTHRWVGLQDQLPKCNSDV